MTMDMDSLQVAIRRLDASWRRGAVGVFMRRSVAEHDEGRGDAAAFFHALAIALDDAERGERDAFRELTSEGSGELVGDEDDVVDSLRRDGWELS